MLESDENQDEDSDGDGDENDENDDACLGEAILELVLRGHTVGSNYRPSAFKLDQTRMKTVKTVTRMMMMMMMMMMMRFMRRMRMSFKSNWAPKMEGIEYLETN